MATEPFATIEELQARLDFEMDETERRLGVSALADLSDEARHYGSTNWLGPNTSPPVIRTWVLKAASRYMKNIEGYVQSRAGMESVTWHEYDEMGTASFSRAEIKAIQEISRPPVLNNVGTYAYGRYGNSASGRGEVWVPTTPPGRKFPLIADGDPLA